MYRIRITTAALVSSVALAVSAAPFAAQADQPVQDPCAKRQTQVDKAEAALAHVTAVFAKQQAKVADAKNDVAEAHRSDKAEAKAELVQAKHAAVKAKKAKKAQQMRLAKANERLSECTAAQPPAAS